MVNLTIE